MPYFLFLAGITITIRLNSCTSVCSVSLRAVIILHLITMGFEKRHTVDWPIIFYPSLLKVPLCVLNALNTLNSDTDPISDQLCQQQIQSNSFPSENKDDCQQCTSTIFYLSL